MKRVDCPTHGESVLRLAQGRLADAEAVRAEQIRQECQRCCAWWLETFDSQSTQALDLSVREAIREFRPPTPVRRAQWDRVAAAAVVALVVGSLLFLPGSSERRQSSETGAVPDRLEVARSELILSEGFEGKLVLTPVIGQTAMPIEAFDVESNAGAAEDRGEKIFSDDLEKGSLDGWSQHS